MGRPRAPGLALSRTPPRVREDAAYVRTGQEVEHYPRMDLEDINVDEMDEKVHVVIKNYKCLPHLFTKEKLMNL